MREILFRGKRVDNGEWVYGDLVSKKYILQGYKVNGGYVVPYNTFEVIPETVGQFTGLTDKNGKRIFEGDIIIFNRDRNLPNSFSCPRVVFYDERNVQFTTYASPYATLQKDMMSECEVVGNIHDNPDLLEGSMNEIKQMEITRQEMERLGIAFRIRQGARQMLKMFNEDGYIPKRPRVEVGKKVTEKQYKDFYLNAIYNQALEDTAFLESYLLGEEMVFFWGSETIKNKEYKTLRLVPSSRTKTVTVEVKK